MADNFFRKGSLYEVKNDQTEASGDLESDLRRLLQSHETHAPADLAARIAAALRPDPDGRRRPRMADIPKQPVDVPVSAERAPGREQTEVAEASAAPDRIVPDCAAARPAEPAQPEPTQERNAAQELVAAAQPSRLIETVERSPAPRMDIQPVSQFQSAPQPAAPQPNDAPRQVAAHVQHGAVAEPLPKAETAVAPPQPDQVQTTALQADFPFLDEHPLIPVPFTLFYEGRKFEGKSLSVTHLLVSADEAAGPQPASRGIARLQVHFDGFDMTLQPEVALSDHESGGALMFHFTDPTGPHLPQLRYVLNNTISGDVTTLNGLLSYTGPVKPKAAKPATPPATMRQRVRSIAIVAMSGLLVLAALAALYSRYTTGREMHPVFIDRSGQQMRATAAGQIGYLNADATQGEVIFSLNANTGDILNFVLPCDCSIALSPGIAEGTTVLPSDLILTIFRNNSEIRAETMISVEGLARAMEGDSVFLDLNDGRSLPVEVVITQATNAATMRGGLFVPVQLRARDGALAAGDIGKTGRLRITSSVLQRARLN